MTRGSKVSGRFVLRIEPELHAALRRAAAGEGISLNEYCARRLALPSGTVAAPAVDVIRHARRVAHDALVGVAVFGSWARDEMATGSDVDVLIVLDESLPIDRGLYRAWDEAAVWWDGHPVEPHFVQLPAAGAPVSSVWAEVAIGGVILYETDFAVSRRLVAIRQKIADGRIIRRTIHGQPYWIEAALRA
ncbi:MAG: toxin-antitoxin system HicB family antitoxin [Thermoanaerobaculia bacterium]